jgi:hypothetical protein
MRRATCPPRYDDATGKRLTPVHITCRDDGSGGGPSTARASPQRPSVANRRCPIVRQSIETNRSLFPCAGRSHTAIRPRLSARRIGVRSESGRCVRCNRRVSRPAVTLHAQSSAVTLNAPPPPTYAWSTTHIGSRSHRPATPLRRRRSAHQAATPAERASSVQTALLSRALGLEHNARLPIRMHTSRARAPVAILDETQTARVRLTITQPPSPTSMSASGGRAVGSDHHEGGCGETPGRLGAGGRGCVRTLCYEGCLLGEEGEAPMKTALKRETAP